MTISALFLSVIALAIGAIVGWVVGSARKGVEAQRALAERDLARDERAKSDAARAEMQRRLEEAQQTRAAAEARALETQRQLGNHKQVEETFTALAQNAFKSVSESLVQSSKTQIDGQLDATKAEIGAMLEAV